MQTTAAGRRSRLGWVSLAAVSLTVALGLGCASKELDADAAASEPSGTAGASSAPVAGPHTISAELFPENASSVPIFSPPATSPRSATALAFNPLVPAELWAVLRPFAMDAPCTSKVSTGCNALRGEVAVISAADSPSPSGVIKRDANAWHFMRRPTCIAFGDNGNFATCAEARTGNYEDEPAAFVGPTLWSSDPAIFGVPAKPGQNGTHLDMLHETPFCMGIAHEIDNIYWTFNGDIGALDRYDFNDPHPIGGEDHTDGELHRYVQGELSRVPEVPSHLALDKEKRLLYVADTGHARVVRLDIDSGAPMGEVGNGYDGMPVQLRMVGAVLSTFVSAGILSAPSGVALHRGVVLVTDNADGKIYVFDEQGALVRTFETGLPPKALAGITVGPDARVYFSNLLTGQIYRVE